MKITITGASGLVGRALIKKLSLEGHEVRALVRSPDKIHEIPSGQVFKWSSSGSVPTQSFRSVDAIIHLAGEGIANRRWTKKRKKSLWDSRIDGTESLIQSIESLPPSERPQLLVSASAIGFYGDTGDKIVDEGSPKGSGFLSRLCGEWENAAQKAEGLGLRVVIARFGVVLAREGGALSKMGPFSLGDGRQWMSWIHIKDLLDFLSQAISSKDFQGIYNLVSPEPTRNRVFTRALAQSLHFPFVLPVPAVALKLVLGEMSQALLASQRVLPKRLESMGFRFSYPHIESALEELYLNENILDQRFSASQFVPHARKELFQFFSRVENLEAITPAWLNFHVLRSSTSNIEKGTLIEYQLKIRGIPIRWQTLISDWSEGSHFVDEQLKGPYKKWHHVHSFGDVPKGTLLIDEITYRVPGGILGGLLLSSWIRKDVEKIFSFRRRKITELFPKRSL
ncbi:MAG: TIGR01777 family oxidoreductase [Bdellovibrionaceae bacterium]|nr:TIGR01777 family oxidoreductase [Pseudobdellovibrionaceae bacterium]